MTEEKKTLGQQLYDTAAQHASSSPIESGELAHEGGKRYMKELIDTVENHSTVIGKYYIQVLCKKPVEYQQRAVYFRFFSRRSLPGMAPDEDVWYVNNDECRLELLWSLPNKSDFHLFLTDPENHDPQLVGWIHDYLKLDSQSKKDPSLVC